jgi:hypothetical protein
VRAAEVDRRIDRQLAAIEAGVDPVVVGERIRALKLERAEAETAWPKPSALIASRQGPTWNRLARSLTGCPTRAVP